MYRFNIIIQALDFETSQYFMDLWREKFYIWLQYLCSNVIKLKTYNFLSLGILWSASNLISLNGLPRNSNVIRFFGRSSLSIVFIRFPDKNLQKRKKIAFEIALNRWCWNCSLFHLQLEIRFKRLTIPEDLTFFPICTVSS